MTISPKNLSVFNNQLPIVIQNEKAPGAPPPQGPFPSLLRHHHSVPQQPTSCPFGIHPLASFLPPAVVNYGPWLE